MGIMDNLKDRADDMMNDPDTRSKIEQIAKEHNMSIEEAKQHFMRQHGS